MLDHAYKAFRKSIRLVDTIAQLFSLFVPSGRKNFLFPPWPFALWTLLILFVVWKVMAHLMRLRKITSRRLPLGYFWTLHKQDFAGPLSSRASRVLGPISRYRVADILLHMKLVSRASRPGLLVGFLRTLVLGYALHRDFTLKNMIIRAVLDAKMNLTLSLTLQ